MAAAAATGDPVGLIVLVSRGLAVAVPYAVNNVAESSLDGAQIGLAKV